MRTPCTLLALLTLVMPGCNRRHPIPTEAPAPAPSVRRDLAPSLRGRATRARAPVEGPALAAFAPLDAPRRFPFTLLHKPLYALFELGEKPEGKDILTAAALEQKLWVHHAAHEDVRDRLSQEQPGLFSEFDEWGNPRWVAPALRHAWTSFTLVVPASYQAPAELRWTAVPQRLLDGAAGRVRGRTPADVAAMKALLRSRLADVRGPDWHAYRPDEDVAVDQASRLFVYLRDASGREWRSPESGARWTDLDGDWTLGS